MAGDHTINIYVGSLQPTADNFDENCVDSLLTKYTVQLAQAPYNIFMIAPFTASLELEYVYYY